MAGSDLQRCRLSKCPTARRVFVYKECCPPDLLVPVFLLPTCESSGMPEPEGGERERAAGITPPTAPFFIPYTYYVPISLGLRQEGKISIKELYVLLVVPRSQCHMLHALYFPRIAKTSLCIDNFRLFAGRAYLGTVCTVVTFRPPGLTHAFELSPCVCSITILHRPPCPLQTEKHCTLIVTCRYVRTYTQKNKKQAHKMKGQF